MSAALRKQIKLCQVPGLTYICLFISYGREACVQCIQSPLYATLSCSVKSVQFMRHFEYNLYFSIYICEKFGNITIYQFPFIDVASTKSRLNKLQLPYVFQLRRAWWLPYPPQPFPYTLLNEGHWTVHAMSHLFCLYHIIYISFCRNYTIEL